MKLITSQCCHRKGITFTWIFILIFVFGGHEALAKKPSGGGSGGGLQPPLTSEEVEIRDNLSSLVNDFAVTIGERNIYRRPNQLAAAAAKTSETFSSLGYTVNVDPFVVSHVTVTNLEVVIPGTTRANEIIVIGAHYDTASGSPGADDNTSGLAGLLEIARLLSGAQMERTVRLVAFVNEEELGMGPSVVGSARYAAQCRARNDNIVGMFSLEMIGYYTNERRSQSYPRGITGPSVGNFIAFFSDTGSNPLVSATVADFTRNTNFPCIGIAAQDSVSGIGDSDHSSFWTYGYPALMVTDTAYYRYAYFHSSSDTPGKLTLDPMARVVGALAKVIRDMANP